MNIYDVSARAGVSIATVSRVVNDSASVSEKTRRHVLEVMREMNYTPNVFARGLGTNSMNTVGVLCADASDAYQAHAIYHLEQALQEYDYNCILCCTGYRHDAKEKYMALLRTKRADAIVLIGSTYVEEDMDNQKYIIEAAKETPVFLLNAFIDAPGIYSRYCDDDDASCAAVSLLLDEGCRDILFLYSADSLSGRRKKDGYLRALKKRGIPVRKELILHAPHEIMPARDFLYARYEEGLRFDGVMATEDYLAVSALKLAHHIGARVPEDLRVIGYNDSTLARCTEPELTSVDSRVGYLSHATVNALMQVLAGQTVATRECIHCALVRRGTTL